MTRPSPRPRRLVHLAEGAFHPKEAKTSAGVIRYGIHESVAIIDSTNVGKTSRDIIGNDKPIPIVASLAEALAYKPDCLLIGVAPRGGKLPDAWRRILLDALEAGLDIYSGLHTFISDDAEFAEAARRHGRQIWDVRKAPKGIPVAEAKCRFTKSYVNLSVGSDCSVGKMSTSLQVQRAAMRRGMRAEFVATGQTGILISGWGHPIDAIPGDFIAGAVEQDVMSVDGECDMILVEGQGSLLHPGYSSVTMGLIHGCLPDSMIFCHEATRRQLARDYGIPFPPIMEMAKMHADVAGWVKETKIVGIAMNTFDLNEAEAREAIRATERETGLPTADAVRFGAEPLLEAILAHGRKIGKFAR